MEEYNKLEKMHLEPHKSIPKKLNFWKNPVPRKNKLHILKRQRKKTLKRRKGQQKC